MKQGIITTGVLCLMIFSLVINSEAQDVPKKIKVGVYDNRAIAVAYFGSEHNAFLTKRAERLDAVTAGDSLKIRELDAWVEKFQRQLHFQGFCRVPVDDLLMLVKDKMPDVAKRTGVDMIGWNPDYSVMEVETIDITAELVALFDPSELKLKQIESLKGIEPTALADVNHDH